VGPSLSAAASGDLTRLLVAWRSGDDDARSRLLTLLYPELERMARSALRGEAPGFTLSTGDLLHEAFLRLDGSDRLDWQNRAHFFALAARTLRRIVIDHCRRRGRRKRGDGQPRLELVEAFEVAPAAGLDEEWLLALDRACEELEAIDPDAARVVDLRFFAGMSYDEIAEAMSIGRATAFRHWRFARAWLRDRLAAPAIERPGAS
jgi:RNA polymerase sigma factor (TIGR02999 family)